MFMMFLQIASFFLMAMFAGYVLMPTKQSLKKALTPIEQHQRRFQNQ